jgi:hypothetical protein
MLRICEIEKIDSLFAVIADPCLRRDRLDRAIQKVCIALDTPVKPEYDRFTQSRNLEAIIPAHLG